MYKNHYKCIRIHNNETDLKMLYIHKYIYIEEHK